MPHVLFISSSIPPLSESQTIRNVFFLRGLSSAGFTITVLTLGSEEGDASLLDLMPQCTVIRTWTPRYDRCLSFLGGVPCGKKLQWLYGIYANFFMVPDSKAGWDRIIKSFLKLNPLVNQPDVIVSASGSYTAHISAAGLAQKYCIPFVAELGDPWTYNPIWPSNFFYRVFRNKRIELKTIVKCSALIVTTEETAEMYRSWLGDKLRQVHVVTMGYMKSEFPDIEPRIDTTVLSVTYVGVAYRTGRNLIPAIDALAAISSKVPLTFRIVGSHSRSFERYVQKKGYDFVSFCGRVSYQESLTHIKNADILVVIGNPGGLQVPGKVFMYLASGRPILLISQDTEENDPSWQILKRFPGTQYCRNDSLEIARSLAKMTADISCWKQLAAERLVMPDMENFEWDQIGRKFARIVSNSLESHYV